MVNTVIIVQYHKLIIRKWKTWTGIRDGILDWVNLRFGGYKPQLLEHTGRFTIYTTKEALNFATV